MVLMVALSACGGGNDYVGTWKLTKAKSQGIEISVEEYMGECTLVLEEDGTAKMTISGEEDEKGKWEATDKGVKIIDEGEDDKELIKDGDILYLEEDGAKLYFEKQ